MDDKVCIETAHQRNCLLLDNDHYRDWLHTGAGHAGKGAGKQYRLSREVQNWFASSYNKVKVIGHISSDGAFTSNLEKVRANRSGRNRSDALSGAYGVVTGKDGFEDASPAGGSSSALLPPSAHPGAGRWTTKTNRGRAGRTLTPITETHSPSPSVSPQLTPAAPIFGEPPAVNLDGRSHSSTPPRSTSASPQPTPKTKGKKKSKKWKQGAQDAPVEIPSPSPEDEEGLDDW